MQGKTVMVTGATSGIGEVTALELARMGAKVIVVSRNETKCRNTVTRIQEETGNKAVDYLVADLSSMASIRELAAAFHAKYDKLHVLVNNAGGFFMDRRESVDGFELTFALNHLNYFLLTHLLLDTLKATADEAGEARIVNVSSGAHTMARNGVTFDDLQREKSYSAFPVYGESKLMNLYFTYLLSRKLNGTNVSVNALHPGAVNTGLGHDNKASLLSRVVFALMPIFALTPEKGAQTSIYLASSPDVKGVSGLYFDKKKAVQSSTLSYDEESQERLWAISEELTGIAAPAVV